MWLLHILERLHGDHPSPLPPLPPVDREAIRAEMKRTDPDFARVSDVQHDAMQALGAQRLADGMAIRREREFWTKHGRHEGGAPQ